MIILGIDYGEKQVGVAISYGTSASPLTTFFKNEAIHEITQLIRKMEITTCIIGLPQGKLVRAVKTFGSKLKDKSNCPVFYWDETLSSKIAQNILISSPYSRKHRQKKEHETAAAVMLESYLEYHQNLI